MNLSVLCFSYPNFTLISHAYRPHSSGVVMAVIWLLIVLTAITTKEAFCVCEVGFGCPPPLPEEGTIHAPALFDINGRMLHMPC